jgi:transcriptional regulator with XRE-family HTH domain
MRRSIARVKTEPSAKPPAPTPFTPVQAGPVRLGSFDSNAFFDALDAVRLARGKNWKELGKEAGISPSTLTRMAQGKRPDVDSLAALARWSDLSVDSFMRGDHPVGETEPLAMISSYLKSDKHLSPEGAKALDAVIRATYERLRKE